MSSKNSKGTVVFDLDGTLVDSARDLVPCLNRTISREGLKPISMSDVGNLVGQGVKMMIERAYELNQQDLDESTSARLFISYLADYEANIADQTVFFDGCLEALDNLDAAGWKLAVCTNKLEHLAVKLLNEMGEMRRFSFVSGGDTFALKKPDPGHILQTIERAGGVPGKSIMVGDSINDIAAAQAAGIPSIAVDFGYTDVPVKELKPDRIISHFSELENSMAGLL